MAQRNVELGKQFKFRNVQIFKHEKLGAGSYGAVYKARCDELPCAAKKVHPILFQWSDPGEKAALKKFTEECEFLRRTNHPNIVQYLGMSVDQESGLPVLLMELMDETLTHFLEQSQEPLAYHVQVDLCTDVALALAYLHSNDIVHRDLSSNNVLLLGKYRAKVTDFGMTRLLDSNPRMTPLTQCPGTTVYMPPEALKVPPLYTSKLDCFSHGVLTIQIMTRKFPDPGPMTKEVEDTRSPVGTIQIPVRERDRRKSHIDTIHPSHPLLHLVLKCLEYKESDRPSAQELCSELIKLKEGKLYMESVKKMRDSHLQLTATQEESQRLSQELQQKEDKVKQLSQQVHELSDQLQKKEAALKKAHCDEEQVRQMLKEATEQVQYLMKEREEGLDQLKERLEWNKEITAELQHTPLQMEAKIQELSQTAPTSTEQPPQHSPPKQGGIARKFMKVFSRGSQSEISQLVWKKCRDAPCALLRGTAAVSVDKKVAYFCSSNSIFAYGWQNDEWTRLPDCPKQSYTLAVLNGLLTAIGGDEFRNQTDSLHSLSTEGKEEWVECFPPMPTKRSFTATVTFGKYLIVMGGEGNGKRLTTVEIMNTETHEWLTASSLPDARSQASATICGDNVYLIGGYKDRDHSRSVFMSPLTDLLQSCHNQQAPSPWKRLAKTPLFLSMPVTVDGQLVAIGGCNIDCKPTDLVYAYDPEADSWHTLSHMNRPRLRCLAAVGGDTVMVVGGCTSPSTRSGSASFEIGVLQ